jgi:Integrase zinc binding domain/Integrase core domain
MGEELQVLKNDEWLNVPPVVMRVGLVRDIHTGLGHCGRDKLLSAVQDSMWWPGVRETITEVLLTCDPCQKDKLPKPLKEPPRFTNTTPQPGMGWSIDLAGPFPPDEHGNTYLAVAVDVFSKWVEASPLKSKHAFRTCEWFYTSVIARWGRPAFVRSDNGTEWHSEFK